MMFVLLLVVLIAFRGVTVVLALLSLTAEIEVLEIFGEELVAPEIVMFELVCPIVALFMMTALDLFRIFAPDAVMP